MIYLDYENIYELLKVYGKDPLEIDFFKVIQEKLSKTGLNVIDFIVYGNFEKDSLDRKKISEHTRKILRSMGIQTRSASNNGKNASDMELAVDTLKDLYKNPNINIFVLISSDRDIIPLLKAIKYENKISYVISTQNGFNQMVAKYADFHEFIETIFNLSLPGIGKTTQESDDLIIDIDIAKVSLEEIQRAREVANYFYNSHIWQKASAIGEPVSLKGYLDVIAKVISRAPGDILEDFNLAHCMKYVTIYRDPKRGLCLKQGQRIDKFGK